MFRIVSLTLLLSLAACGFKPVYAKTESNIAANLQDIRVEPIEGRDGQILRGKLEDLINPEHQIRTVRYLLQIELNEEKRELGIREDLRVTRYDVILVAKYRLYDTETNQLATSGVSRIKSSFNRTESEFSTFIAEEDSSTKAAEEIAEDIRSRLIIFFSQPQT